MTVKTSGDIRREQAVASGEEAPSLNTGSYNPLYDSSLPPEERLEQAHPWYNAQIEKLMAKFEAASTPSAKASAARDLLTCSKELEVLASVGSEVLPEIDASAALQGGTKAEQIIALKTLKDARWPAAKSALEEAAKGDSPLGELARKVQAGEEIDEGPVVSGDMIFWGRPGVGKTELLKQLEKESSKESLQKTIKEVNTLQSENYMGPAEENVQRIFQQLSERITQEKIEEISHLSLEVSDGDAVASEEAVLTPFGPPQGGRISVPVLFDELPETPKGKGEED